MKNISANSLFHFTPTLINLTSILKNYFYPRYCLESWTVIFETSQDLLLDRTLEFAFPMTCFCDIPLSQITNHSNIYGKYAIGLTKDWGMKNKINPVLYAYKDSMTTTLLEKIYVG